MQLEKVLEEIRKNSKERKFDQSVDLIVNLRKFDIKKNQLSLFIQLPHKIKNKKICGFIETKTSLVDTINKASFVIYKDKKAIKKLVKKYDFFIASAGLMPAVATTFGRVLGPASKMPSPQLGIVTIEDEKSIKDLIKRIESVVRVRTKEPTIKLMIAKQEEKDEDIAEKALIIYNEVFKNLPRQKENLRSVLLKLTMGKPVKVEL